MEQMYYKWYFWCFQPYEDERRTREEVRWFVQMRSAHWEYQNEINSGETLTPRR